MSRNPVSRASCPAGPFGGSDSSGRNTGRTWAGRDRANPRYARTRATSASHRGEAVVAAVAATATTVGTVDRYRRVHFWLVWPLQVHRATRVPLAVPCPMASRHREDWALLRVPSDPSVHCWFG
ncbi:hypothetical protein CLV43_108167 [Umezawaea tangerina]|uniref:Uncharacterized protein n=1 Tax=Umezawaea tangerina TaxID=84725 RepID=A0A2T0SZD4_9PSEU|nr:hypothetical protein CLV43_108167 [Umezawaea tangerina]